MATTTKSTKKTVKTDYNVIAGLDIGNGLVKGKVEIDGTTHPIDVPSAMTYTSSSRLDPELDLDAVDDLANHLEATVVSSAVPATSAGRLLFGTRAVTSGGHMTQFHIDAHVPKSHEPLSVLLALDVVASQTIAAAAKDSAGDVPESLCADCVLSVALPIDDYMEHRTEYRDRLMREPHHVICHNYGHDIDVKVTFTEVAVVPEGVAALAALRSTGPEFMEAALTLARSNGATIDASYTGEVLMRLGDVIGIDVGEGTVNFPVFSGGSINTECSKSINQGFGNVLDDVVDRLRQSNTGIQAESRGAVEKILLPKIDPEEQTLKARRIRERVMEEVDRVSPTLVEAIADTFTSVWRRVGTSCEVVYIYGGGARFIANQLQGRIEEICDTGGIGCPVVYLDSAWSRNLNAEGLYKSAKKLAAAM
ncbi:ParM/StbA family protein [Caniella muris]|uniref:ParM/StbA family protein n=1 Tax=Caniella muris TaxID=2941502 RepID=UPI0020422291|nr:ParM/StbA family protein [Caniella muris]